MNEQRPRGEAVENRTAAAEWRTAFLESKEGKVQGGEGAITLKKSSPIP